MLRKPVKTKVHFVLPLKANAVLNNFMRSIKLEYHKHAVCRASFLTEAHATHTLPKLFAIFDSFLVDCHNKLLHLQTLPRRTSCKEVVQNMGTQKYDSRVS